MLIAACWLADLINGTPDCAAMARRCATLTASLQSEQGEIRVPSTASYPTHGKERGWEGEVTLFGSEYTVWEMNFNRMKLLLQFCFLRFNLEWRLGAGQMFPHASLSLSPSTHMHRTPTTGKYNHAALTDFKNLCRKTHYHQLCTSISSCMHRKCNFQPHF